MNESALRIADLSAGYGGRPVLDHVNLELARGEAVALIGPNGCGKSTLLKAISAEIVESGGEVLLNGEHVAQLETDRVIRKGVGYLRQTRNVFPGLSVARNLELARIGAGLSPDPILLPRRFDLLRERMGSRAGLLSGGERQALAVAMILQRRIELLMLDEPIAGLSERAAIDILESVREAQQEQGFALILVEHRLRLIQPYVSRAVVMVRGKIVEDAWDTAILVDRARLERLYLS